MLIAAPEHVIDRTCECPEGLNGQFCQFVSCNSEFSSNINKFDSGNTSHRKTALANTKNSIYVANYVENTKLSIFNLSKKMWEPVVNEKLDSSILQILNNGRDVEKYGNNRLGSIDISGDTLWVSSFWGNK